MSKLDEVNCSTDLRGSICRNTIEEDHTSNKRQIFKGVCVDNRKLKRNGMLVYAGEGNFFHLTFYIFYSKINAVLHKFKRNVN